MNLITWLIDKYEVLWTLLLYTVQIWLKLSRVIGIIFGLESLSDTYIHTYILNRTSMNMHIYVQTVFIYPLCLCMQVCTSPFMPSLSI